MHKKILVGYVPEKISIDNEILTFLPRENISDIVKEVKENTYIKNGFCFPVARSVPQIFAGSEVVIDESKKMSPRFQPEIFRFDNTHEFQLKTFGESLPLNEFYQNPSFFLMQVIGYISGYRVMPSEFWHDGKIPVKPTNNLVGGKYDAILIKSYNTWLNLSENERNDLQGLFYLFNRSPSYHWDFEKFTHDFIIFDSAKKFYEKKFGITFKADKREKKSKYSDFLSYIRVSHNLEDMNKMALMRNSLFHEMKWAEGSPTFSCTSEMLRRSQELRKILHAVLGRLINLEGEYFTKTNWSCIGTSYFDAH